MQDLEVDNGFLNVLIKYANNPIYKNHTITELSSILKENTNLEYNTKQQEHDRIFENFTGKYIKYVSNFQGFPEIRYYHIKKIKHELDSTMFILNCDKIYIGLHHATYTKDLTDEYTALSQFDDFVIISETEFNETVDIVSDINKKLNYLKNV